MPTGYRNYLSIKHEHKTVPYCGSGEMRPDGDANYGFKNLKSHPELIDTIPELIKDPALMKLARAINAPDTGLCSIGCVSDRYEERGHLRYSGYMEIAFNSRSHIVDPSHYFSLFFDFDHVIEKSGFDVKVEYNWSLQPATFIDQKAAGYTCTIFLNTYFFESEQAATEAWEATLDSLGLHLGKIPIKNTDYLFPI